MAETGNHGLSSWSDILNPKPSSQQMAQTSLLKQPAKHMPPNIRSKLLPENSTACLICALPYLVLWKQETHASKNNLPMHASRNRIIGLLLGSEALDAELNPETVRLRDLSLPLHLNNKG